MLAFRRRRRKDPGARRGSDGMTDPQATSAAAAVSEARQWARLEAMAALGGFSDAEGNRGVNRPCLTAEDRAARRLLISWGAAIGLAPSIDALGNLFLRREGTEPGLAPVLAGSHMDTQPQGGRFDGIWGVLAALEAIEAIHDAGLALRRPIELVAWTNEEGGRFAPGCMGSMAYAGHRPPDAWDAVTDGEGTRFADALAAQLAAEADLPRRPLGVTSGGAAPFAYVEPHIEQGPVLEAEGLDIGIVTGIQGSRWFLVELEGRSDHAGTTPLARRRDPVQDMLRAIAALNALTADSGDVLRFTVGRIEVSPNTSNSVASRVRFTIDLRHPDAAVLKARGDAVAGVVQAAVRHCAAVVTERFTAAPSTFAPLVPDAIARAAAADGLKALRMPSGAFHDAQFLVPLCPAGMIFVPCSGGVSHHPAEYAEPAWLAAGARVLARVLVDLAGR